MKKRTSPLVIGNWKMNPSSLGDAKALFVAVRGHFARKDCDATIAVAPPFPFLAPLSALSPSKRIMLVAQDVFTEPKGAYTGEVSLPMLKSLGVSAVIIGHSERRALGETDTFVAAKAFATVKAGLTAVVCIGERERDHQANYFSVVETQLRTVCQSVPKAALARLVVAYEPIWAIGTGNTATPADAYEMRLFIQKILTDCYGRAAAKKVRILYGGSVKPGNAAELLKEGEVDGFLVGGASLAAKDFISIITAAHQYVQN